MTCGKGNGFCDFLTRDLTSEYPPTLVFLTLAHRKSVVWQRMEVQRKGTKSLKEIRIDTEDKFWNS